jgi:hypothetical protein
MKPEVGRPASPPGLWRETMSISTVTWCDICNPLQIRGSAGRGYAEMPRKAAIDLGWIRRNGKDICIQCQHDEDDAKAKAEEKR